MHNRSANNPPGSTGFCGRISQELSAEFLVQFGLRELLPFFTMPKREVPSSTRSEPDASKSRPAEGAVGRLTDVADQLPKIRKSQSHVEDKSVKRVTNWRSRPFKRDLRSSTVGTTSVTTERTKAKNTTYQEASASRRKRTRRPHSRKKVVPRPIEKPTETAAEASTSDRARKKKNRARAGEHTTRTEDTLGNLHPVLIQHFGVQEPGPVSEHVE